jgi:hypothetical protein
MAEKECTKCRQIRPISLFSRDSSKRDGLYSSCKDCTAKTLRSGQLEASRRWKARNREHIREYKRRTYVPSPRPPKDPTAQTRARSNWKKRNPESLRADRARRRALEINAMPSWAQRRAIAQVYRQARRATFETGVLHHVDHIVPLRHKQVCGLHVHENLRVVTARENYRKSNKWSE